MKTKTTLTLACVSTLAICGAQATTTLYSTDFSSPTFSDGNLVGQDGWINHSGSGSQIQVSNTGIDGIATLAQGSGSREDASVDLGVILGAGSITMFTASFDVTVGATADADALTTYFVHFKDGGTGFNGRTFVTAPNTATNNFTFGIGETSSSTPAATFATDFAYGTTYNMTLSYDFTSGISVLDVAGVGSINSTSQADPGEDLQFFSLRQSGGNTTQVIDNLVITPEPSTMLLGLIAGVGFVSRRRRH